MIFGQVMTICKVNPDPDPHFRFLCEHGARGQQMTTTDLLEIVKNHRKLACSLWPAADWVKSPWVCEYCIKQICKSLFWVAQESEKELPTWRQLAADKILVADFSIINQLPTELACIF